MKRKHEAGGEDTPTKKSLRKQNVSTNGDAGSEDISQETSTVTTPSATPSKRGRSRSSASKGTSKARSKGASGSPVGSPTPKGSARVLFATPTKARGTLKANDTPSTAHRADRSAKKKSGRFLVERFITGEADEEDGLTGENTLAARIWDADAADEERLDEPGETDGAGEVAPDTPSKRGRGRPKGSRNRSITPPTDLPPHEQYFWDNRPGNVKTSNNTLSSLSLLTYDDYFAQIRSHTDSHESDKAYLIDLHSRSFPQWQFEQGQEFNVCLYGWGSKRKLVTKFAEWLYNTSKDPQKMVIVNGYTPNLTIRTVLMTVMNAFFGAGAPQKIGSQPADILDFILSILSESAPPQPLVLFINSIDASPLRKFSTQTLLARLASSPHIKLLATADTPNFPLLWDSNLREQFNWVFHDCTTFAPYDAEISVVDDVNELLCRRGHRLGGKDGVGFVLKSLPENARSLYRILLSELLTILSDGLDNGEDGESAKRNRDDIGVEYRALYQKASEEFICGSEMTFRTLLKEFYDHQMIISSKDAMGTETLAVPLTREEMEGVLEDLVLG
ncbi:MAG: Origin recognition complex subunit 2 [Cirrosporium novae-zelandiae]|nr:MAG: Origin recognition complex subunit 2 [Cirrosporium novae-zelandiae]